MTRRRLADWALLPFGALGFVFCLGMNPAYAGSSATCTPSATLHTYNSVFQIEPVPAAAATRFLPDDGSGKLQIQVLPTHSFFEVFESREAAPLQAGDLAPIALVAATAGPPAAQSNPPPLFTDANSTQLQVALNDRPALVKRTFIIVACDDGSGRAAAWARVTVRVGDTQTAMWVCIVLTVLTYLFCMLCLRDVRTTGGTTLFAPFARFDKRRIQEQQPARQGPAPQAPAPDVPQPQLADRYPSLFKRQPIGWRQILNPIHLTVNELGIPSVQKFQVVLFSALVVGLLLYLLLLNGALSSLSITVVELIGISGAGAAVSGAVNQQKTRLSFDNWAWLQEYHVLAHTDQPHRARWSELLTTNKEFDIYKMQALMFSIVVGVALFISGGSGELATFKVPDELLGVLGLSQITYIGGLLVQPPAIQNLDAALTKLREARATYEICRDQGTDIDDQGNIVKPPPPQVNPPPAANPPAPNAWRNLDAQIKTIVPMLESTMETDVDRGAAVLQR